MKHGKKKQIKLAEIKNIIIKKKNSGWSCSRLFIAKKWSNKLKRRFKEIIQSEVQEVKHMENIKEKLMHGGQSEKI